MNSDITELNAKAWDLEVLARRLMRESTDPVMKVFAERVVDLLDQNGCGDHDY